MDTKIGFGQGIFMSISLNLEEPKNLITSMTRYLVITIDVEPDCTTTWHYSNPLTFRGVSEGIGRILQPLFNRYNMTPTYLLNNVVIEDEGSCEILKNLPGNYELGTHLHPEFIEPMKAETDYAGKRGSANCCEYPADVEFGKLENITRLFESRFNYSPTSFRAGRFSAGPNTIDSLAKLGYLVDTSVTPHVTWADKSRLKPIDYKNCPEQPYYVKPGAYPAESSSGDILEVPVSISTEPTQTLREMRRTWFGMRRKYNFRKAMWLRPAYSTYRQFVKVIENHTEAYQNNPVMVFNIMFHNVEVLPSLNPYTKTQEECDRYIDDLERFFQYCNDNNIQGIGLSETINIYAKAGAKPVMTF